MNLAEQVYVIGLKRHKHLQDKMAYGLRPWDAYCCSPSGCGACSNLNLVNFLSVCKHPLCYDCCYIDIVYSVVWKQSSCNYYGLLKKLIR